MIETVRTIWIYNEDMRMLHMAKQVTFLTYHYVRDLPTTNYPRIKGLQTDKFLGQLNYLEKYYTFIKIEDYLEALIRVNKKIPKNSCILTFDDGFIDHYETVFPILHEKGIPAAFFPSAKPILEDKVLDVHKIHFILAKTSDYPSLVKEMFDLISNFRDNSNLPPDDELYSKAAKTPSRWDIPSVVVVKQILQHVLPRNIRNAVVSELFKRIVTKNEVIFARKLYMSINQLKLMIREGMHVGGHGYEHEWLEKLSESEQREEIERTVDFLELIYGETPNSWVLSYPYGGYNEMTKMLLNEYNCAMGISVGPKIAIVNNKTRYFIPRFDTNDFPFSGDHKIVDWTKKVI